MTNRNVGGSYAATKANSAQDTMTSGELLRFFWPYLAPHKKRIMLAVLSLFMVAGALLFMGLGLAYLVD